MAGLYCGGCRLGAADIRRTEGVEGKSQTRGFASASASASERTDQHVRSERPQYAAVEVLLSSPAGFRSTRCRQSETHRQVYAAGPAVARRWHLTVNGCVQPERELTTSCLLHREFLEAVPSRLQPFLRPGNIHSFMYTTWH